jgi:FkbH-like protein
LLAICLLSESLKIAQETSPDLSKPTMFETDKYDPKLHREKPASPLLPYAPVENIVGMSFLWWGEHCLECAAPTCYATCDLYEPRSDSRCRRFAFGAYKNPAFSCVRGYGVEVHFKKWGKLEAFGNSAIYPLRAVLRWERSVERVAPVTNLFGKLAHRPAVHSTFEELTYIAGSKLARSFHHRSRVRPRPQAFLLEVYNPESDTVRLQVIFSVSLDDLKNGPGWAPPVPPVTCTLVLPQGYSRHCFEAAACFGHLLERGLPFKITMVPEGDTNVRLIFLTADLVTFHHERQNTQGNKNIGPTNARIKCVVWDLDNTIWNGTLAEGDELTLRTGIVDLLRFFDERGVLMSIASKNALEPASALLKNFGIAEFFLYPQADWLPKSHKIRTIAQKLNIGLDSLAFIDDNQFELDEVSRALPEVTCISIEQAWEFANHPQFHAEVAQESRQRRRYYQQQIVREAAQASYNDDYFSFLKSCNIVLEIARYEAAYADRLAELVQRTNQLNFSGRKYSRAQLEQLIANPALEKYVLRCWDKYGDYGTIGFGIVHHEKNKLKVSDFMLSCRVQGKFIEQAFFSHIIKNHNPQRSGRIWVNFRATDRNAPARQVLESLGFLPCSADDQSSEAGLRLNNCERLNCDFITVVCAAENEAEPSVAQAG